MVDCGSGPVWSGGVRSGVPKLPLEAFQFLLLRRLAFVIGQREMRWPLSREMRWPLSIFVVLVDDFECILTIDE